MSKSCFPDLLGASLFASLFMSRTGWQQRAIRWFVSSRSNLPGPRFMIPFAPYLRAPCTKASLYTRLQRSIFIRRPMSFEGGVSPKRGGENEKSEIVQSILCCSILEGEGQFARLQPLQHHHQWRVCAPTFQSSER